MQISRILGYFTFILFGIVAFLNTSCRKDLDFENANTTLRFSQDTLVLDTVFSNSTSETYLFKVYNDSDKNISIPRIYLDSLERSYFRINVDGRAGYDFSDIPLRKKDSLLIFVDVAAQDSPVDFIYEDVVNFSTGASDQKVHLISMIEDVQYFYPASGETYFDINSDTTWDNSISKVVYGTLRVTNGNTLSITPGTRVYFHHNSGIEVEENATLNVVGTLDEPVNFRGDRQDPRYDTIMGVWNDIRLKENALANFNYAVIKNGTNGILAEKTSTVQIENTQIYLTKEVALYGKGANITGRNVAINHAGAAALGIENGGNYNFLHCTFANVWLNNNYGNNGNMWSAFISNYTLDENENTVTNPLTQCNFTNCIFYGEPQNAVFFDEDESVAFNYSFQNNLFKNEDTSTFNFGSTSGAVIGDPYFISVKFSDDNLRLGEESAALRAGNSVDQGNANLDGVLRDSAPNLGAY